MNRRAKLYLSDGQVMYRELDQPMPRSTINDSLVVAINEPIEEDGDVRAFSFSGYVTDDSGEISVLEYRERKTIAVNGTKAGGSEAPR